MWIRYASTLMVAVVILFAPTLAEAKPPGGATAKKEMLNRWKAKFPDDKKVEVKQDGEAVAKVEGQITRATVPFKVTVTRSKGATVYNGYLNYVLAGRSWVFESVGVGDSQDVAPKGETAPPRDEVKALVRKFFASYKPEDKYALAPLSASFPLKLEEVKVSEGTYFHNDVEKTIGYRYAMAVVGTDADNKKWDCTGLTAFISRPEGGGDWSTHVQNEYEMSCK